MSVLMSSMEAGAQDVAHQRPVGFDDQGAAVPGDLLQFARPLARAGNLLERPLKRLGVHLQQRLGRLPRRLLGRPAVQALGALVPIGDAVLHVAHQNGVLRLVEQ